MNVFHFLFFFGVITLIFGFLMGVLAVILTAPLTASKVKSTWLAIVLRFLSAFIISALVAGLTNRAAKLSGNDDVYFYIIGFVALAVGLLGGTAESMRRAAEEMDEEFFRILRYDYLIFFFGMALFVVCLFVPVLSLNPFTLFIFRIIGWILDVPVLGFIIKLAAIAAVINLIVQGFGTLGFLAAAASKKRDSEKPD